MPVEPVKVPISHLGSELKVFGRAWMLMDTIFSGLVNLQRSWAVSPFASFLWANAWIASTGIPQSAPSFPSVHLSITKPTKGDDIMTPVLRIHFCFSCGLLVVYALLASGPKILATKREVLRDLMNLDHDFAAALLKVTKGCSRIPN
jgi:hypothetical protein